MEALKNNISNIVIMVFLLVFVFVRMFDNEESVPLVNAINFAGIMMAVISLMFEVYTECKDDEKIKFFIGLSIVIIIALLVVTTLILLSIISPSNKANDIITLVTLLISLPYKFHKKIICKILKN